MKYRQIQKKNGNQYENSYLKITQIKENYKSVWEFKFKNYQKLKKIRNQYGNCSGLRGAISSFLMVTLFFAMVRHVSRMGFGHILNHIPATMNTYSTVDRERIAMYTYIFAWRARRARKNHLFSELGMAVSRIFIDNRSG